MKIANINYLSELAGCNPENDNLDVHILLDDGRGFTFTIAAPQNILWCMEHEGIDYFSVKNLTQENIERALENIVEKYDGKWLAVYGA